MTVPPPDQSRIRRHDRVDDRKDASRIFRYCMAAAFAAAGIIYAFWEAARNHHGADTDAVKFWIFCAIVILGVTYPETKGYLSELAKVVRRRNGKSDDTDEHQTGD